ncbi:MAG: PQQ-binding-like beta-propeller repeat protein [Planctomycetales bacterium]|nr:PQQ-binding-like beta-propeller repeat protein [Planctomycetales bacterium]
MRHWICYSFCVALMGCCAVSRADSEWPQWRGPSADGHAAGKLPTTWSVSDVAWRTELPGRGQSSPVIWSDRIFLTAASEDGGQRIVMCLRRSDGELLWQKTVSETAEPEPLHKMNTFASATCATDGERVVAFFGRGGLHALDFDGNVLWSRELGEFAGPWGTGASPIIVGDLVIQNCDAEEDAYLLGVDKRTGETRWKTQREKKRGWSTPVLVERDGRRELALNGELGVDAYDPATGEHLWFSQGDRGRGSPTVVTYRDMVIAVSGRPGDMWATRIGGSGSVNSTHEVWRTKRASGRDLPSPIVVGDRLVVCKLQPGIVQSYNAASGEQLSQTRIEGNFAASPIAAGGLVYMPNDQGDVYVLDPSDKLKVVAKNSINPADDELFRASLAVADGQIYLRSDRVLYCIGRATR